MREASRLLNSQIPTESVPSMASTDWKRAVHEKRLQRERAIAEFKAILGPEFMTAPLVINDIDGIGILASKISKGDLTSEEVTKACIARYLLPCPCSHTRNCNLTANLEPLKLTKR
jgi:hypothetical protein